MKISNLIKKVLTVTLAVATAMFLIDFLSFFILPESIAFFASAYKKPPNQKVHSPIKITERLFPKDYFLVHPTRGFDNSKNFLKGLHKINQEVVKVFTNDLACFDKNTLDDFNKSPQYDYIAGDSFTWGYADYEKNYPTVYENDSSRLTAKCGVNNTGQLHEFEKFKEITSKIGKQPARVVVGYFANDPMDDYAHPHSTVLHGYLVDSVLYSSSDNKLVKRSMSELENEYKIFITGESTYSSRLNALLSQYSFSYNLLGLGLDKFLSWLEKHNVHILRNNKPVNIYYVRRKYNFQDSYLTNPITERNREAIKTWVKDSKEHGYELIFLLIPEIKHYADTNFYSGLKKYLKANDVQYIDMTESFAKSGRIADDFYWKHNHHWNNQGNEFAGHILANALAH